MDILPIKPWGEDGMDYFSKPNSSQKGPMGLGTLYEFDIRVGSESKPGRSLIVLTDDRLVIDGFTAHYSYLLKIRQGVVAGNHFHKFKREIFTVDTGVVKIKLQDPSNPKCIGIIEMVASSEKADKVWRLHIPVGIAHSVECISESATIHIAATYPNINADEFAHMIGS